jgi:hypothetical protein
MRAQFGLVGAYDSKYMLINRSFEASRNYSKDYQKEKSIEKMSDLTLPLFIQKCITYE